MVSPGEVRRDVAWSGALLCGVAWCLNHIGRLSQDSHLQQNGCLNRAGVSLHQHSCSQHPGRLNDDWCLHQNGRADPVAI